MPASGLALALKVASLNLCADEYLLLLAHPSQVASVSYLSQHRLESPLWKSARRFPANGGSIEHVIASKPDVVLTMHGRGRASRLLASRLGLRLVTLQAPSSLADVHANLRQVGALLGQRGRAAAWTARLHGLERSAPAPAADAIWLSGGGLSLSPGVGPQWLRLTGLEQRQLPEGRATLEMLLTRPPKVLVRSDYRSGQMSGGEQWLRHPIVRRAAARQLVTDGRAWTCMGPLMIPEIERLRRLMR